jgi:hypothetical protein
MSLDPGSPRPQGWTILGKGHDVVHWVDENNKLDPKPSIQPVHEHKFVNLIGYALHPETVPGIGDVYGGVRLWQPIAVEKGKSYRLSFQVGTHEGVQKTSAPVAVMVIAKGLTPQVKGFVKAKGSNSIFNWSREDAVFKATADSAALEIWAPDFRSERLRLKVPYDSTLVGIDNLAFRKLGRLALFVYPIVRVLEQLSRTRREGRRLSAELDRRLTESVPREVTMTA